MMYLHYCKHCKRIHILNGHKPYCPRCCGKLQELRISYLKYVNMEKSERDALKARCANPETLAPLLASSVRLHAPESWLSLQIENYHARYDTAYSG